MNDKGIYACIFYCNHDETIIIKNEKTDRVREGPADHDDFLLKVNCLTNSLPDCYPLFLGNFDQFCSEIPNIHNECTFSYNSDHKQRGPIGDL